MTCYILSSVNGLEHGNIYYQQQFSLMFPLQHILCLLPRSLDIWKFKKLYLSTLPAERKSDGGLQKLNEWRETQ
jgi:hypothetical protein